MTRIATAPAQDRTSAGVGWTWQPLAMGHIRYEVDEGVATITIDRPEKRNAMTYSVLRDFTQAIWRASDDPAARVVIVTGAGGRSARAPTWRSWTRHRRASGGARQGSTTPARRRPGRWPAARSPSSPPSTVRRSGWAPSSPPSATCGSHRTGPVRLGVRATGPGARHGRGELPAAKARRTDRRSAPPALRRADRRRGGAAHRFRLAGRGAGRPAPKRRVRRPSATSPPLRSPSPAPSGSSTRRWRASGRPTSLRTRSALEECFASEDHAEGVRAFLERRPASFTGR